MRGTIKIILLLILCSFFLANVDYIVSRSAAENVKQKRPNSLHKLHFIPKHDLIVAVCGSVPNGSIRFWSINDGKLEEKIDLGEGEWAESIAVSNSGNLVVIGLLRKNEIACYSLAKREWSWRVNWVGKSTVVNVMQFTPDDRKLSVVGSTNIVTYDAETGTILRRQEDGKGLSGEFPRYRTRNKVISPSSRYAAFFQGNLEHNEVWWRPKNIWVVVRDIETAKIIAKQEKIQKEYKNCSAAFTPDEKNLVLGSMDGYLRVWSITEEKVIRHWKAHGGDQPVNFRRDPAPYDIFSIVFSHDGRYLATMGFDAIRIWDFSTNKLIHEFVKVISSPLGMCSGYPMSFSPDGKYFAFEQQGQLCLYDTQSWQEKWCVFSWPEDYRVK